MPGLPLISVVIPVYDVAASLPRCLDSVLAPGGDVEVIAVDDASPDGCGTLLDARAAADPRLHVVHLAANGGPGAARNAGLARATGEYVWFVDADDCLSDGALPAVTAALGARPDVLLIGWDATYDGPPGRAERTVPGPGRDILDRVPAAGTTLEAQPPLIELSMTSWSKLLRREFLAKLGTAFGPGIHEDVIVTCAALLAAESVAAVPRPCYRYRRDRRGQFMGTPGPAHRAIFAAYHQVFDLLDSRAAAGTPPSPALAAAVFDRAIWHYTTVFQATGPWPGRGSLVPRAERRPFFARMHADFIARRPPGYRRPPGARGLKFALIERNGYLPYIALEPLNKLRVAAGAALARRKAGRPAGDV
ncbi:MAG TPA: glycosyltransferase family 2 protein [Streptosporangiaceae bacterium]